MWRKGKLAGIEGDGLVRSAEGNRHLRRDPRVLELVRHDPLGGREQGVLHAELDAPVQELRGEGGRAVLRGHPAPPLEDGRTQGVAFGSGFFGEPAAFHASKTWAARGSGHSTRVPSVVTSGSSTRSPRSIPFGAMGDAHVL